VLLVVAVLLLFHTHQGIGVLGDTGGTAAHSSYLWPFLVVVALVLTQIVGFETAGAFAEETRHSRIRPSQAILAGCAGTALVLFVFDFCLLLALPNVGAAMKEGEELIPGVLTEAFGTAGQKIFLLGALIAVMSTSIATLAAIVRTMYGMARDGQLPGSAALTRLSPRTNEPVTIIVVAALLSMVPLLVVKKIPVIIAAITALILVPYLLVLGALLLRRMRGWPQRAGLFRLGRWGLPLTIAGIVWVVLVLLDALWPRAATNPDLGPFPIIEEFGVTLLVLGGLWWYGALRRRPAAPLDPEGGTPATSSAA
jgi:amino acid transporter